MPYIKQEDRPAIDECLIDALSHIDSPGKLNYAISTLAYLYLNMKDKVNYDAINEVMGVLACAKEEFYRRVAVPYEDKKIAENGDVY